MALPNLFASTAVTPTPAEFGLALLVIKSKPGESSLEEHIHQLRRCLRSGPQSCAKRLDSCAFWKVAYEKSEASHTNLLDKNHELEQQIEQLRGELRSSTVDDAQTGLKRKRSLKQATETSTSYESASKKAGLGGTQRPDRCLECTDTDLGTTDDLGGPAALARNFFALRRYLSARRLDSSGLAKSLSRTCAAADASLSESIKSIAVSSAKAAKAKGVGEATLAGLMRTSRALRLCCPSLLRAVEKLSSQESIQRRSVYAVVQLFQDVLGHLHDIAAVAAGRIIEDGESRRQNKPCTVKQQPMSVLDFDKSCRSLTKLAIQFLETLDLAQISHNKVLEGFISVFLDHLGSSLSLIVFANKEYSMSESVQLGVLPPCGLLDTVGHDQETALSTVQHEARYLVTILRKLMIIVDKQQSLMRSNSVALHDTGKSLTMSNSALAANIRDKLQHTLLRGVFGDDDDAFKEAIRRPDTKTVDHDISVAYNGREDVTEWFVGEVWALVGWNSVTG